MPPRVLASGPKPEAKTLRGQLLYLYRILRRDALNWKNSLLKWTWFIFILLDFLAGGLQRCSDVFPVSRCLLALKTLQCHRRQYIGRCRRTCCDCDDYQ